MSTAGDDLEEVREGLERHSTEELVTIVSERNTDEWRPEVFDIARSILSQRGLFAADIEAIWRQHEEADAAEGESSVDLPSGGDAPHPVVLASSLGMSDAEELGKKLTVAKIPFIMDTKLGYGVSCYVPSSHERAAFTLLEDMGIGSGPADAGEPVGLTGGACPACGGKVPAGSHECPECKLGLGGDPKD
jgi:hypothetical protein